MKIIKVFFASSEELENDREAFGNFVRRLNENYNKRGIHIELFQWEDYDAAYNCVRKQEEYNEKVRASDMFLAVFHRVAGKFTIEEFNVATEEFMKKKVPKVYVYCKDLKENEKESNELIEFKQRLIDEMGHYWSRYSNKDTLKLHFIMQLQQYESLNQNVLKVENGMVMFAGTAIAKMDNLQFVAGNQTYQRMQSEIAELPNIISKARDRVAKFPDDEDLRDDLQQKLNYYNTLKDEFANLQTALLETAKRIASLQIEHMNTMLRRAIDAFEIGNIERANVLLDELAIEAEEHMAHFERQRTLLHQDIEVFRLQARTIMADFSIPIEKRKERTTILYLKAIEWAKKSTLDKTKYTELLFEYATFLKTHAQYSNALEVCKEAIDLMEEVYGKRSPEMAILYDYIGQIKSDLGKYDLAIKYFKIAVLIIENNQNCDKSLLIDLYNNMGVSYHKQSNYTEALKCFQKSLEINSEQKCKEELYYEALINHNIGLIYLAFKGYKTAENYFNRSVEICDSIDIDDEIRISLYNSICSLYLSQQGQILQSAMGKDSEYYTKAAEYCRKSFELCERTYGVNHPITANCYMNIGSNYIMNGEYIKAFEYLSKGLMIYNKILGDNSLEVAYAYYSIGIAYLGLNRYEEALKNFDTSLAICEARFNTHAFISQISQSIISVYQIMGQNEKAAEYESKYLNNAPTLEINVKIQRIDQIEEYKKSPEYKARAKTIKISNNLFRQVAKMVVTKQSCSVSQIQRDFELGVRMAFKLIDELKELGIIKPSSERKNGYEVLIKDITTLEEILGNLL